MNWIEEKVVGEKCRNTQSVFCEPSEGKISLKFSALSPPGNIEGEAYMREGETFQSDGEKSENFHIRHLSYRIFCFLKKFLPNFFSIGKV